MKEIADLQPGMALEGVVTNVTKFGAFVDVGVHQDGLVHISELSNRYVKDPSDVVKVGQIVKVQVLSADRQNQAHRVVDESVDGTAAEATRPSATTGKTATDTERQTVGAFRSMEGQVNCLSDFVELVDAVHQVEGSQIVEARNRSLCGASFQ